MPGYKVVKHFEWTISQLFATTSWTGFNILRPSDSAVLFQRRLGPLPGSCPSSPEAGRRRTGSRERTFLRRARKNRLWLWRLAGWQICTKHLQLILARFFWHSSDIPRSTYVLETMKAKPQLVNVASETPKPGTQETQPTREFIGRPKICFVRLCGYFWLFWERFHRSWSKE